MIKNKNKKLTRLCWQGRDADGNFLCGENIAPSLAILRSELRQRGITLVKVKKRSFFSFSSIHHADIIVLSRQLATLVNAGIPLMQALDLMAQGQEKEDLQALLQQLKSHVETGGSLSEALMKFPSHFDSLYCGLIHVGEQAGVLDEMLLRIADYQEKSALMKAKIKKSLFYPMLVLVVSIVVTSILLIYVVPQFDQLFKSFGAALPMMTRTVMGLSSSLKNYGFILAGFAIVLFTSASWAKRRFKKFKIFYDRCLLRIPMIGKLHQEAIFANFSRVLMITYAAGLPLVRALDIVKDILNNHCYASALQKVAEQVTTGQQLYIALRETRLFPTVMMQMIRIGESSGSLEFMLGKMADFYESRVDRTIDNFSQLLEPVLMAILGIVVGGLVIAMYLPIFQLGTVIS